MIAVGRTLKDALWRAHELETLAKHYHLARQIGSPVILPDDEIERLIPRFAAYGTSNEPA
jgi:L-fuculose-phosphate aldolase